MMDFELKLEKPNVSRAWILAAAMGASYFIGKPYRALGFCAQSDISQVA
jgi:vacuolar iron transporter family protein